MNETKTKLSFKEIKTLAAKRKQADRIVKDLPDISIDLERLLDPNDPYPFDDESLKIEG